MHGASNAGRLYPKLGSNLISRRSSQSFLRHQTLSLSKAHFRSLRGSKIICI